MSRIGKLPIEILQGVEVTIEGQKVIVKGPKGSLERLVPNGIEAKLSDGKLLVEVKKDKESMRPLHGTTRSLLAGMVQGVKDGWVKTLELVGTGYRAEVSGNILTIQIGFSHPVRFDAPDGISFKVVKSEIIIEGFDKELVGQIAAKIRSVRPPEPYKGKGIKYKDEVIRRKAGKAAKAAGA